MKLFVLCSYTDALNDPVVSGSYEEVYKNMEQCYHMVVDGVSQMEDEKENTYLGDYSAQAVMHGEWMEWQITTLEIPIPAVPPSTPVQSNGNAKILVERIPENPYLAAYLCQKGLTVGDHYSATNYMLWVDEKHDEFRKMHHLPEHITLNDTEVQEFIRYLNQS